MEGALSQECDNLGSPSTCLTAVIGVGFSSDCPLFKGHNLKSLPQLQSPSGTSSSYVPNLRAHYSPLPHLASAPLTSFLLLLFYFIHLDDIG